MPLSQTHPKLGAIRRQFSHLSSSSRPKCKLVFSSKSVSPPLIDQTAKVVDSNENQVNFPSTEFDLSANLEAYKKRCKTLEMENARLMDNQGKIITESNRKSERHLEEIRCLKEQMDAQRRTNGELLRWAQLADDESRRAKELSKEWQKLGQCNNQLMKKEVHSHQLQINELEAKMAKLATENLELKRLCLYLDEQRQAFWRELASAAGNTKVSFSTCSNSVHHFPMECGRCSSAEDDITCRRSGGTNASLATELVDLKLDKVTKRRGKLNGEEENEAKKGAIRMDYGQEEVLQSICYELTNSMATSSNGTNESVMAPNFSGSAPQIGASGNQPMTTVGTNCASIRPLSNSTVISNCPSAASTPLYSEFAGFSFSSLEDPTAVVVGHELDNTDGERSTAEQGLKVHELCTISEEEEKTEGKIRHKLVEKLGRELAETLDGAGCCSMVAETGSMFTFLLQSVDQPKQQQLIEAFGGMELSADLVINHRNSTGGSSTSSGAFSGISRYTDEDSEDTETMEGKGKGGRDEAEDDLPPRMPLITPNECRPFVRHSFREFPSDHRSSSSMAVSVTAVEQQFLQRQSSTLPRLPLFTEPQSHGRTKTKLEGTTESQKGKQSQQMPVRVRVRPPPMQLPGVIKGDCQAEGKGEGGESHGSLVRIVQRMGTAKNGLLGEY